MSTQPTALLASWLSIPGDSSPDSSPHVTQRRGIRKQPSSFVSSPIPKSQNSENWPSIIQRRKHLTDLPPPLGVYDIEVSNITSRQSASNPKIGLIETGFTVSLSHPPTWKLGREKVFNRILDAVDADACKTSIIRERRARSD
jgi:hypothetical protein